jgi:heptaprenyl diphosphate synthase
MVLIALLTGLAIVLMAIERMIPIPVAVPGVKLGLANVVTLTALYLFTWRDTLSIILLRVLLGSLILGSFSAFMFSLGGALMAFVVMALLVSLAPRLFSVVGVSVCGAVAHNIGQLLVAAAVVQNLRIVSYLPVLLLAAVGTGLATGYTVTLLLKYLKRSRT